MSTLKTWVIEEIDLGNGQIGHRQSILEFDATTGDLVRPDERMDEAAIAEWDRIMAFLQSSPGEDLCHIVNGPALLDHCVNVSLGRGCRKRGTVNCHEVN